jgi:hypothetical protein
VAGVAEWVALAEALEVASVAVVALAEWAAVWVHSHQY